MHRIILEAAVHQHASFLTLTYNDDNLPDAGSLVPRDLTLFFKRMRKHTPLRYFAVGEYGDESERPHYHAALFGVAPQDLPIVESCWDKGFAYLGDLTMESAQYVCGYVVKKLTRRDDPLLGGRYPEFARMSRKPGIGALAVREVADALSNRHGWDHISETGDVPAVLRHGSKVLPLGRYIRSKLRQEMNFAEIGGQPEAMEKRSAEMLVMYQNYLTTEERPLGVRHFVAKLGSQKLLRLEAREKIFGKKGSI